MGNRCFDFQFRLFYRWNCRSHCGNGFLFNGAGFYKPKRVFSTCRVRFFLLQSFWFVLNTDASPSGLGVNTEMLCMIKIVFFGLLATFFLVSAIVLLFKSKWNMGSLAMWVLAAGFSLYTIFMPTVDHFTQSGPGFVLKVLLLIFGALFGGLMVFLAVAGRSRKAKYNEKVLIVLGAGLHGEVVSDILQRRLEVALHAHKTNPNAVIVVTGGQGYGEAIPEALAMQRWLLARGVPQKVVLQENKSISTKTNLLYTREILGQHGIMPNEPVAVITNTFHCFRARCYAKQAGFTDVRSLPAGMNRPTFLQNYLREGMAFIQYLLLRLRDMLKK